MVLTSLLGFKQGSLSLPDKVVKKGDCDVLISALATTCARWKTKGISYGSKLQLLNWGVHGKHFLTERYILNRE